VFIAGCGTIVSAFFVENGISKTQLLVGIAQLLTSVYIIGWLLSLYWAYKLIEKSGRTDEKTKLVGASNSNSQANNPYAVLDA